jgi:hypothetical protein
MGKQNYTEFHSHFLERNLQICRLVLTGRRLNVVADLHKLAICRVRNVTMKFCRVANPEAFKKCAGKLGQLRAHSDLFLPRIIALTDKYKERS